MKNRINQLILNDLKEANYPKKTGIYSLLIIDVLEEANKLPKNVDNVFVDHNVLEAILLDQHLFFLHDLFGRSKGEFPESFLNACFKLSNQFAIDYVNGSDSMIDNYKFYYGARGFGTKLFIRSVIENITRPLFIEIKQQPIYVTLSNDTICGEPCLWIGWYIGKRRGKNVLNTQHTLIKKISEKKLLQLQNKIEKAVIDNGNQILEFEQLEALLQGLLKSNS